MKQTPHAKRWAIFSLLLLALLACGRTQSLRPTASTTLSTGESRHALTHDDRDRSYLLYVPVSVDWNQAVPLVFTFHGGTGNAQSAIIMSEFNEVADQNGFIVVYPNGTGRLREDILLTWNGGTCCAYAQVNDVDDVGFVRAIVADLQSQANIDPHRIYATGMSNGGLLSHRLACEAADIFAAVAPVAGTLNFPACQPTEPISIIEFHGTDDQHIPYEGGNGSASLVNVSFASAADSVEFWATFDGCNPQPQTSTTEDIRYEEWTGCMSTTAVVLYSIIGGGHAWPGGVRGRPEADQQPTESISASQVIWEFFAAHPKP